MELTNINDIRAVLSANGFTFSKSMGQNFLTAAWVPERIADECGAGAGVCALEIGPGIGCLTEKLCERAERVIAVELDKRLIPVLAQTLAGRDNLTVINADVMALDLNSLDFAGLRPIVAANLPYNITSPVITKLLSSGLFSSVTVMVQREVADRICAEPKTADYGAFTLFCRYKAECRKLFNVPSSCFEPRPKVESAVVRMDMREKPPVSIDEKALFRVIRAAFNQRRKTLANALSSGLSELDKEKIKAAIEKAGLSPTARGEELSLEKFAALTQSLFD
ncbi:MAG: ribosomal RNA small subunit methyltransferase A [Oscillospiraceae bacterium]|nr:ribosomal RNA small subunit methyltransferase A [Oscillospiraceae bacterium]MBQ5568118.1 ribosomal RNA small subunit methyltransferase A [Oscillospiraceae bacterium]